MRTWTEAFLDGFWTVFFDRTRGSSVNVICRAVDVCEQADKPCHSCLAAEISIARFKALNKGIAIGVGLGLLLSLLLRACFS